MYPILLFFLSSFSLGGEILFTYHLPSRIINISSNNSDLYSSPYHFPQHTTGNMVSSLLAAHLHPCIKQSHETPYHIRIPQIKIQTVVRSLRKLEECKVSMKSKKLRSDCSPRFVQVFIHKSMVPVAASLAVLLGCMPAHAGFLSGFSGIESVPGPQLPEIDFLTRFNEENQKKYAENDARFKESPLLKKLLERSKQNKEKNKQAILDKYCIRGAEWGVGDCSAEAMSPEERENFIAMLKQKAGIE